MSAVKDFKSESEWKWQYHDQENKLYVKRDDNEYDEYEHDKINLQRMTFKNRCKKRYLSAHYYGILGVFQKGNLRIFDSDQDFTCD